LRELPAEQKALADLAPLLRDVQALRTAWVDPWTAALAAFTVLGTFEVVTDWVDQLYPADSLSKE
jgi:hypothetical protein